MVDLHFDRSDSKKALTYAVAAGLVLLGGYVSAGWISGTISGSQTKPSLNASGVLFLLPYTAFRSTIWLQLTAEALVFMVIGSIIGTSLGFSILGFLAQWLLFSLGLYRMERADYAEQTKPADPTKFPPGQI